MIVSFREAAMLMTKRRPASVGEILAEEFMEPLSLATRRNSG
jgi:plasmid maintenance system antidote protein VapI